MEVFRLMIPLVKEDYCDYEDGKKAWKKTHGENVKRFKKSRGKDFNEGIIIPFTCNYETFIYPVKDGECYIETCNNHPWQDVLPGQEVDSRPQHEDDDKTEEKKDENKDGKEEEKKDEEEGSLKIPVSVVVVLFVYFHELQPPHIFLFFLVIVLSLQD
jgi:hypothetical protein